MTDCYLVPVIWNQGQGPRIILLLAFIDFCWDFQILSHADKNIFF